MTFKEKMMRDDPNKINSSYDGGVLGCPSDYGYEPERNGCDRNDCADCWNREIPTIKDSGERRQFETGAVRDIQEGKGRCDLMPLDVVAEHLGMGKYRPDPERSEDMRSLFTNIERFKQTGDAGFLYIALNCFEARQVFDSTLAMFLEVSKHFEEGAKKYGENNWQKGIPTHCYIDSAVRHCLKHFDGETDEPHDRAFVWNIMCCIWTCMHKPELNDYGKKGDTDGD